MTQVQTGLREVGPVGQGLPIVAHRVRSAAQLLEQQPGVVQQLRARLADFQKLRVERQRLPEVLNLYRDGGQAAQRLYRLRIQVQDLPEGLLGPVRAPHFRSEERRVG